MNENESLRNAKMEGGKFGTYLWVSHVSLVVKSWGGVGMSEELWCGFRALNVYDEISMEGRASGCVEVWYWGKDVESGDCVEVDIWNV